MRIPACLLFSPFLKLFRTHSHSTVGVCWIFSWSSSYSAGISTFHDGRLAVDGVWSKQSHPNRRGQDQNNLWNQRTQGIFTLSIRIVTTRFVNLYRLRVFRGFQDLVLIRSKDQLTAFNAVRKNQLEGKARIANRTTVNVFKFLNEIGKGFMNILLCSISSASNNQSSYWGILRGKQLRLQFMPLVLSVQFMPLVPLVHRMGRGKHIPPILTSTGQLRTKAHKTGSLMVDCSILPICCEVC